MIDLVLASSSPRRKALLAEMGYVFKIQSADVEELHDASFSPRELCEHNARLKAEAVAQVLGNSEATILAADTLVYLDKMPLGKPKSRNEAEDTLLMLAGKTHCVCTGLCLMRGRKVKVFSEVTEVRFKEFGIETVHEYMAKAEVMDKAGSYAIQEYGEMLVEGIEGDYSNVVGLPQGLVRREIKGFELPC